ncbi:MAG: S-methyl-5-thioribose-1-phosphate isomerase [Chitinophagales bacterium]
MNIKGKPHRTIWLHPEKDTVFQIIDQRHLPHRFVIEDICTSKEGTIAIKEMWVRGAPLIGATAAYSMYLATLEAKESNDFEVYMQQSAKELMATRPTAINLQWAIQRQQKAIAAGNTVEEKVQIALQTAKDICEEDVVISENIGNHGLKLIEAISEREGGGVVNILTHCNAGWLATVDWGTATAPIYKAHEKGIKVHVWVDETRPRNQGARLTAWELQNHGVPHTVIVDNVGGHLMQHGMVDMCIVGTDRTTYTGDVANKIGTYLKALAAKDNNVPFYVALPSTTIDWELMDGLKIPIEERNAEEVTHIQGLEGEEVKQVLLTPPESPAANYAFDVTPARLVTALITERGVCEASEEGIRGLFDGGRWTENDGR